MNDSELMRLKRLCDEHMKWLLDNTESLREAVVLCEATADAIRNGIALCGQVVTEKTGQA